MKNWKYTMDVEEKLVIIIIYECSFVSVLEGGFKLASIWKTSLICMICKKLYYLIKEIQLMVDIDWQVPDTTLARSPLYNVRLVR